MDGLYACGPVIKICCEYGWDYMLVFKEGAIKDAWRESMGLIRLTPENIMNFHNFVDHLLMKKSCFSSDS